VGFQPIPTCPRAGAHRFCPPLQVSQHSVQVKRSRCASRMSKLLVWPLAPVSTHAPAPSCLSSRVAAFMGSCPSIYLVILYLVCVVQPSYRSATDLHASFGLVHTPESGCCMCNLRPRPLLPTNLLLTLRMESHCARSASSSTRFTPVRDARSNHARLHVPTDTRRLRIAPKFETRLSMSP
jgi:hypothetical protein